MIRPFGVVLTAALLGGFLLVATPVSAGHEPARAVCGKRASIVKRLATGFMEFPVARGLAKDGTTMLEVFASADRTWTVIVTQPDGTACAVASGEHWKILPRDLNRGI